MITLLTGAGGVIVSLVLTLLWRRAVRQAADAERHAADYATYMEAAREARTRAEGVVRDLRSEIVRLEADLAACSDPRLVRARLRALLTPPAAGVPAADPAAGT